ncbi:phospholipase A1 4-like, partial [Contarinia nasturtii]|uniref:phospholipase A1 4-like n=1 Tax=Contarinia nasturtii TaxID=265458 RepID=UPI0012D3E3AB
YSFEEFQVMRLEEIPSFFCGSFNPYKDIDIELYSPNHRVHPAVIQYNDIEKFGDEYFNKSWPTKVIIHGFISGNNWFDDLAPHFSEKIYGTNSGVLNHHNLISINWRKGASYTYMCAHQFVESVGNLAGDFIYRASNAQKMNLSTVEIIGHSLGAHVAGFIGKSVHSQSKGKMSIQRIIALDAAGPCFHSMIPPFTCLFLRHDLELKREDANEVIALHTNSRKIMQVSSIFPLFSKGYWGLLGTVDLWLNGGMVQDDNTNILSHLFAVKYYLHIMYMEKPLTGYTFNFDDVDSKYTETAMLEEMKKNYMNPIEKVSIFFNETLNQKLGNRIALFVDTNSVENDPTIP